MKYFVYLFFTISYICQLFSQTALKKIGYLPPVIHESSGIIATPQGYWTHNDGRDSARIFLMDTNLHLIKTFRITNSFDKDVEEIAQDQDFIYLNDMGNNQNNRRDLRIYKLPKNQINNQDSGQADIIEFYYEDQAEFPPQKEFQNFDCEAFVAMDSSLYLFSKNRGKSIYSKIYRLDKKPGTQVAKLIDSIATGKWVTAAALSPSQTKLAILASHIVYIFSDFTGTDFKSGKVTKFSFPYTQKEGIAFRDENTLLLTDEKNDSTDGCLYSVSIDPKNAQLKFEYFTLFDQILNGEIYFYFNDLSPKNIRYEILDSTQKAIQKGIIEARERYVNKLKTTIPDGNYQLKFSWDNEMEEKHTLNFKNINQKSYHDQ